jgi:UDP-glucose 4-epimerase
VKRLLVTGGAGFIGSRVTSVLLTAGYEVDVVDDLSTGSRDNVPPGARLLVCDVTRAESLASLDGDYAAILHLAGQSSGEKSFDDPARDFDANGRSTVLLAHWALAWGIPTLLHASSMGVYGATDGSPISENAVTKPISWYGASKLAAENALEVAGRLGLRTCSFRMFSVYGPGQNLADERQGMVSIYLAHLLRGVPVTVKGTLERARDFVYIDDVVAAWKLALESEVSGVFNLGTGVGTRVGELLAELIDVCGLPGDYPREVVDGTPGDQFAVVANPARAREELGWRPRVELRHGLEALVAWARMASGEQA